jgi:hypothetical protein
MTKRDCGKKLCNFEKGCARSTFATCIECDKNYKNRPIKIEKEIIDAMDMSIWSMERKIIKKLFDPNEPAKPRRSIRKTLDGLIMVVHERNCLENSRGKRTEEDYVKLALCDGEIRGILYSLGYDVRL